MTDYAFWVEKQALIKKYALFYMLNINNIIAILLFRHMFCIIKQMLLRGGFIMEIRVLRYFLAVVREEGINRAAEIRKQVMKTEKAFPDQGKSFFWVTERVL